MRTALLLAVLCTALFDAAAQSLESRFSVSATGGRGFGDMYSDIEKNMRASGFEGVQRCGGLLFCNPIHYPTSSTDGPAYSLSFHYQVSTMLGAGIAYSYAYFGTTSGGSGVHLDLSLRSVEGLLSIGLPARQPPRLLSLAIGLGLYTAAIKSETTTRPGVSINGILRVPRERRVFFEGRLAYRLVGDYEYGPFDFGDRGTLPRAVANFSHFAFTVGIGMRLGRGAK